MKRTCDCAFLSQRLYLSTLIEYFGRGNVIIGFSKSQTSSHITHDLTISFGMSDLKNHILTSDSSMGACVENKPIPCK